MKKYRLYKAIDFAQDRDFIRWIKNGETDEALSRQWNDLSGQSAEMRDAIEEARTMVQGVLNEKPYLINEQKKQTLWNRIDTLTADVEVKELPRYNLRYAIAAAISVMIALAGLYIFFYLPAKNTEGSLDFAVATKDLIRFKNERAEPNIVVLQDGSKVTLMPGSTLAYPGMFDKRQRQVYLSGEAFFEITKDPKKPFLVFANELVTQVLGTSFNIRAYEQERNISVLVKTGKVSVYPFAKSKENKTSKDEADITTFNGTLLLPNQQIVYSRDQASIVKSLIEQPVVLTTPRKDNFQFEDAPICEVFSQLEKAYGVDIVYDEEELRSCFLNASIKELSFHDKLRLICKGINATYEILDTHIIITGGGCQ